MGSLPTYVARRPLLQITALLISIILMLVLLRTAGYLTGINEALYFTDGQQESQLLTKKLKENSEVIIPSVESPLVVVLLASLPRSGSSMMGQLLNSMDEQAVYFFEPLYAIKHTPCIEDEKCVGEFLAKRYNCSASKAKECSRSSTRVIKLVRGSLENVGSVLKDTGFNVKVIHLTRDPRGALRSISSAGWDSNPTDRCKEINEDMDELDRLSNLYSGRVMKLSYERFCVDFESSTKNIYKFLYGSSDLPVSTVKYLDEHMQENEKGYRNIHRNASSHYQEWRMEIKEVFLKKIENEPYCQTILKRMGYALFGTKESAKNYSYPLFLD